MEQRMMSYSWPLDVLVVKQQGGFVPLWRPAEDCTMPQLQGCSSCLPLIGRIGVAALCAGLGG